MAPIMMTVNNSCMGRRNGATDRGSEKQTRRGRAHAWSKLELAAHVTDGTDVISDGLLICVDLHGQRALDVRRTLENLSSNRALAK